MTTTRITRADEAQRIYYKDHPGRLRIAASTALDWIGRAIELPANVKVRMTGRPAPIMRVLCYVSLLLWPILWPALLLIAWCGNRVYFTVTGVHCTDGGERTEVFEATSADEARRLAERNGMIVRKVRWGVDDKLNKSSR